MEISLVHRRDRKHIGATLQTSAQPKTYQRDRCVHEYRSSIKRFLFAHHGRKHQPQRERPRWSRGPVEPGGPPGRGQSSDRDEHRSTPVGSAERAPSMDAPLNAPGPASSAGGARASACPSAGCTCWANRTCASSNPTDKVSPINFSTPFRILHQRRNLLEPMNTHPNQRLPSQPNVFRINRMSSESTECLPNFPFSKRVLYCIFLCRAPCERTQRTPSRGRPRGEATVNHIAGHAFICKI